MLPSRSFGDTVERLVAMGLEVQLAESYLHLLVQGTIRPAAFASALHVSRGEAYRRLERLTTVGLAVAAHEQPVQFEAVDPDALFQVLHRMHTDEARAIQAVIEDLDPLLSGLQDSIATRRGRTFRYLSGRPAFNEELHRLLDMADEEVLMVNTHPNGQALAEQAGLWPRLRQLEESGIRQRILMADHPALRRRPQRSSIRVLPQMEIMNFVIVDRHSTLISIACDESSSLNGLLEKCLATSAPGLLAAQLILFDRLWKDGTAVDLEPSLVQPRATP